MTLDLAFRALGDPTRRQMLERLTAGAQCVGDLAEGLPISLPAVSKHLDVLERAGLVRRTPRGRERWIEIRPEGLQEASEWTAKMTEFWSGRLAALDRHLTEGDES